MWQALLVKLMQDSTLIRVKARKLLQWPRLKQQMKLKIISQIMPICKMIWNPRIRCQASFGAARWYLGRKIWHRASKAHRWRTCKWWPRHHRIFAEATSKVYREHKNLQISTLYNFRPNNLASSIRQVRWSTHLWPHMKPLEVQLTILLTSIGRQRSHHQNRACNIIHSKRNQVLRRRNCRGWRATTTLFQIRIEAMVPISLPKVIELLCLCWPMMITQKQNRPVRCRIRWIKIRSTNSI